MTQQLQLMEETEQIKENIQTNFDLRQDDQSEDMVDQVLEDGFSIEAFFSVPGTKSKNTHMIKSKKEVEKKIQADEEND